VRIGILGPLTVRDADGRVVEIGGARLRTLLIRLTLDAGRTVPTDALVDAVWPDQPPAGAGNALQALVSRLRRALPEPGRLAAVPGGYRLDPDGRDIDEFERLAAAGRAAADPARGAELLRAALALWRGPALVDVGDADFARASTLRLDELRLAATEDRIEAELRCGTADGAVAELTALTSRYPLRERGYGLLMRALAELGRTGEALRVYERLRRTLADELGTDPSPELAALHVALLRGNNRPPGNLRTPLTSFVGRDAELTRVADLLRDARLVTLVGPGGAGKTRLAVEVGRALAADVPDGAWLVELAPVRDPAEVPAAVLEALRPARIQRDALGSRDPLDRLVAALEHQRQLLVLDNCEHLVEASAHLAERLLGACPGVRILATSREPLALTGEALCPVGPLSAPPAGTGAAEALGFGAVRLFADRAAQVRPGFAVTDANVGEVGEICRRLDGLPLAIELATARLRTLPVGRIAARLGDRFRLLSGGSRTALARHQTLQAVVDWSWELLSGAEQRLARRLSVFLDGATLESAETVCDGDLETLSALVDKSFLTLDDDLPQNDGRYQMLETIRVYAAGRLAEAGEAESTRDRHAAYFQALARTAEPYLRRREQLTWLARLTAERDNLSGALRWSIDHGDAATAVGLGAALGWFWALRNYHAEAVDWLGQALAVPGEVPAADRASALAHYALNLLAADEHDLARARYAEAAALDDTGRHPLIPLFLLMDGMFHGNRDQISAAMPAALDHPDPWTRAVALGVRARWRQEGGDLDGAARDSKEALAALRASGDRWAQSILLSLSADAHTMRGDHAGAIAALSESVMLAEELNVEEDLLFGRYGLILQMAELGDLAAARAELDRAAAGLGGAPALRQFVLAVGEADLARLSGDPARAVPAYRRALEHEPDAGMPGEIRPIVLLNLTRAVLATGDVEGAREQADEVRETAENRLVLAVLAEVDAAVAVSESAMDRAARLLGCAEAIRGVPNRGSREVAATVAAAREALGPERYAREYATTAAYSLDEVRAFLGAPAQVLRR
jgi:predicted ATPase/DNA-binding SARP family transcriptional activator